MSHLPLILLALAWFSPSPGPQDGNEWLYAQTGNGLNVYDPESGALIQTTNIPSLVGNRGLVYESGKLFMLNQNTLLEPDFMVELHPATGRYEEIGDTGFSFPWAYVSLMRDPTTGTYYVHAGDEIYHADMETGALTFLSKLEQGVTIITTIAIDATGRVYGYSTPNLLHLRPALFRVDLHSGALEHLGDLDGPQISMRTMAFDAKGRLWGAGPGPWTQEVYRLYRIDLDAFELQSTFPLWDGAPWASAIAFGPKPDVTTYCEPKPNSQSCTPTIAWKGHPSASAPFGFNVSCSQVVPDAPGFLMLGFGGQASLPFQGGTLCLGDPIVRTTPQASGAATGCDGAWQLDVNTWLFKNSPMEPGDRFTCQWWGRDPGIVGRDASQLSDALEVVLLP